MESKQCKDCGQSKSIKDFYKSRPGYFDTRCKICKGLRGKKYYSENKEKMREYHRNYQRELYKEKRKDPLFVRKNREYVKKYEQTHREWKCKKNTEYNKKHVVKRNAYRKVYVANKRKTDVLFRIRASIRNRTCAILKIRNFDKKYSINEYLGCSIKEFKRYITLYFKPGMNWDNYGKGQGKWNFDHTIPLSSAKTVDELYKLCHYTNIKPMWAIDNMKKGNKQS